MGIWDTTNRDGSRSTVTATTRSEAIIKADRAADRQGTALQHIRPGNDRR